MPTPGKGRFWLSVAREHRGRGIGAQLFETAVEYLRTEGAWRVESYVPGDPAGVRFLSKRGFTLSGRNRASGLDLRDVSLPKVTVPGFRLATLGETRDRAHELHAICVEGEIDMPSDEPETEVDFESWCRDEFEYPDISDEGSFVVLEGDQPVSLAFVTVDHERALGYNSMTATLRTHRRRGLALLREGGRGALGAGGRARAARDRERRRQRGHDRDQRPPGLHAAVRRGVLRPARAGTPDRRARVAPAP